MAAICVSQILTLVQSQVKEFLAAGLSLTIRKSSSSQPKKAHYTNYASLLTEAERRDFWKISEDGLYGAL